MAWNYSGGVTDSPVLWEKEGSDLLSIKSYLNGLRDFILKCPTPMSIAIQGDWGTGKTSVINYLLGELKKSDKVLCTAFNTWQYSQFDMSQSLYFSFFYVLVKALEGDKKEDFSKFLNGLFSIGKTLVSNVSGIDRKTVDELGDLLVGKQEQAVQEISEIHDKFQKLVQSSLKEKHKERLVIFVDDLDRLDPDVAVGLLEVMKLFMDAEDCVFVLAVDYDVVVQGIRAKYGREMSTAKCRSFFDKIIQLPFRMPVENYDLTGMVEEYLKGTVDSGFHKILTDFAITSIGKNPRAFKRLLNSFMLIKSVYSYTSGSGALDEADTAALFCCLCIQSGSEETYTLLLQDNFFEDYEPELFPEGRVSGDPEEFEKTVRKLLGSLYPGSNRIDGEIAAKAAAILREFPKMLVKIYKNYEDGKKKIGDLLRKTSITTVSGEGAVRARAYAVDTVVIGGKAMSNPKGKAVDAYCATINECFKAASPSEDGVRKAVEENPTLSLDGSHSKGVFRSKVRSSFAGVEFWIGTSLGTELKFDYMSRLTESLGLKSGFVEWYYMDEPVYSSKNSKLSGVEQ